MAQLVDEKMASFDEKVLQCSRDGDTEMYLDTLRELNVIEMTISQFNALWSRFSIADNELVCLLLLLYYCYHDSSNLQSLKFADRLHLQLSSVVFFLELSIGFQLTSVFWLKHLC